MSGAAYSRVLDALESAGIRYREIGPGRARAACPAHGGDNGTAMSIKDGQTRVSLHCFTHDCDGADIAAAIGLTVSDLYHEPRTTYAYDDRQVIRSYVNGERRFKQQGAPKGRPTHLYRLDRLAGADVIYLVEGEEDVHALEALGVVATTAPQGATNFALVDAEPLRGKTVVAIPDRDAAGKKWAEQVRGTLDEIAGRLEFRIAKVGKDAADHVAADLGVDDLQPVEVLDEKGQQVQSALQRLRVREEARRLYQAEQTQQITLPRPVRLDQFLAVADDPVSHRIEGLWPTGGRVVAAAPKKAGKTTLNGNVIRSLVDGDAFLDRYPVQPMDRLVLVDNELDARMLRRWLRDHKITNADHVDLITLRGRLSTFNIIDPDCRQRWANLIGPADGLILDCLRPALDALGLDESREAGRFLEALDELLTAAGIGEALVSHHHGHGDLERARGDSRILDWPDANWNLVVENDDSEDRRVYFKARGRDVDQPEQLLTFDPAARRLSIGGGSRKTQKAEALLDPIGAYLADNWGASQNKVEKAIEGRRDDVRKALEIGADRGLWTRFKSGQTWVHGPATTPTSPTSPDLAPGEARNLAHLALRARGEEVGESNTPIRPGEGEPCPDCGEPLNRPGFTNRCKPNHHEQETA